MVGFISDTNLGAIMIIALEIIGPVLIVNVDHSSFEEQYSSGHLIHSC
jgi:hypothetical protein